MWINLARNSFIWLPTGLDALKQFWMVNKLVRLADERHSTLIYYLQAMRPCLRLFDYIESVWQLQTTKANPITLLGASLFCKLDRFIQIQKKFFIVKNQKIKNVSLFTPKSLYKIVCFNCDKKSFVKPVQIFANKFCPEFIGNLAASYLRIFPTFLGFPIRLSFNFFFGRISLFSKFR
jgi:hypothetical protein